MGPNPVADQAETPPAGWAALRPQLRQWRRYWVRDPLLGGLDFGLHHACRRMPTEWCSAIGGRLGVLNGRYRFHAARERAERAYLRLTGDGVTPRDAEAAAMRLFV